MVKSIGIQILGKAFLEAEGQSTEFKAILKDADGQVLNSADFPLEWLSSRPQDFSIDNSGKVVALTDYGYTYVTVRVKGTDLEYRQLLSVNSPLAPTTVTSTPTPVPGPVLTGRAPIAGGAGATVVITGSHFANATGVLFGSTPATSFTVDSDSQITAKVPAGTGTVNLSVTTASGTTPTIEASKFFYTVDTFTETLPPSRTLTRAPSILSGTSTTFTSYSTSFSWLFSNFAFKVPVSGNYSFTATTSPVVNTTWILKDLFEPSVTPTTNPVTPLSNFIVQNFSGGNTTTFNNIALEAGQQYSILTAFNQTTAPPPPNYTVVITVTGPDGVGVILTNP